MKTVLDLKNKGIPTPPEIIEACDNDELIARIFFNRGFTDAKVIKQMLDDQHYIPTSASEFPKMDEAVKLINEAISKNELIGIYGDYDVDGVTSTAVLMQCLKLLTNSLCYHVPDRFTEGYGMNKKVIESFANKGVKLIITCDCGVSNVDEVALAKELSMKVIVTDHHNLPENLPIADVILNPKLLEKGHKAHNISGCAMAYFLCVALLEQHNMIKESENFLDLLALSLVADVVSLNGENRYLLKRAIPRLFNTERKGLKAIFSIIEKTSRIQNEEDIGFQIAPRINAAGRMDSARIPVDLMLTEDEGEAAELAQRIDELNRERKRIQEDIILQAEKMAQDDKKNKTILVLYDQSWHHGIIGIAAGKICEKYGKPAILLTLKEDGETVVGSARSIEEVDIYQLIKDASSTLLGFGGHTMAAGLSLKKDNVEEFTRNIETLAQNRHFIKDERVVKADLELDIDYIDEGLYERLQKIGPYGEGFEPPVFLARGVSILSDRKTERNHHIMVLAGIDNVRLSAVKWFGENVSLQGKSFDIAYKIGINTYKGNESLQLNVLHMLHESSATRKDIDVKIIDQRGKTVEFIESNYPDSRYYYEGLTFQSTVKDTISRVSIVGESIDNLHVFGNNKTVKNKIKGKKSPQNLVFISTPVNSEVFKEVIMLLNPENVILNFSSLPAYDIKDFIINLLGLIKHGIANNGGLVRIEDLAIRLCVEETIIKAALKYLKAWGKIQTYDNEQSGIIVTKGSGVPNSDVSFTEKMLKSALDEKKAFQQFILKLNTADFSKYLR